MVRQIYEEAVKVHGLKKLKSKTNFNECIELLVNLYYNVSKQYDLRKSPIKYETFCQSFKN